MVHSIIYDAKIEIVYGTAKLIIDSEEILLTKKCSIEYSKHNYIIESKIKEKIDKNEATEEDMEEYQFQKLYFI